MPSRATQTRYFDQPVQPPPSSPNTSSETPHPPPPAPDRKSTRLNSSHSQISYAVFCLKKKNTFDINMSNLHYHQLLSSLVSARFQPFNHASNVRSTLCSTHHSIYLIPPSTYSPTP